MRSGEDLGVKMKLDGESNDLRNNLRKTEDAINRE